MWPWTFLCGNYSDDSEGRSCVVIGSFITTTLPLMHHNLRSVFFAQHQITQVPQPSYSSDWAPWDFWLFPKLKSPLKGKRFQTIDEIQENTMGQLMVSGRTVWGPKVPTLKGSKASLSYVQCFLYLVSSLINVSIFHSAWLDISGQTSYTVIGIELVVTLVKINNYRKLSSIGNPSF